MCKIESCWKSDLQPSSSGAVALVLQSAPLRSLAEKTKGVQILNMTLLRSRLRLPMPSSQRVTHLRSRLLRRPTSSMTHRTFSWSLWQLGARGGGPVFSAWTSGVPSATCGCSNTAWREAGAESTFSCTGNRLPSRYGHDPNMAHDGLAMAQE